LQSTQKGQPKNSPQTTLSKKLSPDDGKDGKDGKEGGKGTDGKDETEDEGVNWALWGPMIALICAAVAGGAFFAYSKGAIGGFQ
jgi:hypothetical protein